MPKIVAYLRKVFVTHRSNGRENLPESSVYINAIDDTIDILSNKRSIINRNALMLNLLLICGIAYLVYRPQFLHLGMAWYERLILPLPALFGFSLCIIWYKSIYSANKLNARVIATVCTIEDTMPINLIQMILAAAKRFNIKFDISLFDKWLIIFFTVLYIILNLALIVRHV